MMAQKVLDVEDAVLEEVAEVAAGDQLAWHAASRPVPVTR
jgi:hypothetical protein